MGKIVMSLSGGMDSTTMLGRYLNLKEEVHCVHFQYGSKHNEFELAAVKKVVDYYNVPLTIINMHEAFSNMASHLMSSGGDIPEGHYADVNMTKTVVPGRNTIFASVLMGMAESVGADKIALGVHLGDHAIYPDCRREYIKALDALVYLASDRKVEVEAPFQTTDKTGICKVGMKIGVPYELTRTCYKNQPISCGKCGSCSERREAFELSGFIDLIPYEV